MVWQTGPVGACKQKGSICVAAQLLTRCKNNVKMEWACLCHSKTQLAMCAQPRIFPADKTSELNDSFIATTSRSDQFPAFVYSLTGHGIC